MPSFWKIFERYSFNKVDQGPGLLDEALELPLSFFKRMEDELEVFKMQDFVRF